MIQQLIDRNLVIALQHATDKSEILTTIIERYSVKNYSIFNARMCQQRSARMGRFCGSCTENHGLAIYSYHISSCIKCKYEHTNWLKFFMVALLPLTVFYVIVIIFKINLVSGEFSRSVFALQIFLSPKHLRELDSWFHSKYILWGTITWGESS